MKILLFSKYNNNNKNQVYIVKQTATINFVNLYFYFKIKKTKKFFQKKT